MLFTLSFSSKYLVCTNLKNAHKCRNLLTFIIKKGKETTKTSLPKNTKTPKPMRNMSLVCHESLSLQALSQQVQHPSEASNTAMGSSSCQ